MRRKDSEFEMVNSTLLEQQTNTVKAVIAKYSLGSRGRSAAMRIIIDTFTRDHFSEIAPYLPGREPVQPIEAHRVAQ